MPRLVIDVGKTFALIADCDNDTCTVSMNALHALLALLESRKVTITIYECGEDGVCQRKSLRELLYRNNG